MKRHALQNVSHEPRPSRRDGLIALLIAVLTCVVFAPIVPHDFLWWDDPLTLHHNPRLRESPLAALRFYWTNPELGLYVPVTYSAWIGLAQLARLDTPEPFDIWLNPWVFHAASVGAHALSAAVCFLLLRRWLTRAGGSYQVWGAACGALLFALHPLQVESVAWTSGLKDVLGGLFGLLALERHAAANEARAASAPRVKSVSLDTVAFVFFVLGVLSKPTATMIVVIAAVVDVLIYRRGVLAIARSLALWGVVGLAGLAVARSAQTVADIEAVPLVVRPLIAGHALGFYLYKIAWPFDLCIDYGHAPTRTMRTTWVYFAWLVPAAVAGVLFWRRDRLLTTAGFILLLAPLPVLGLALSQFAFSSVTSDHYMYTALLGPAVAAAWAVARYRATRWVALGLLAGLSVRSVDQMRHWKNDRALWARVIQVNPATYAAENALGQLDVRDGNLESGEAQFKLAIERRPDYPVAMNGLASVQLMLGKYAAAQAEYDKLFDLLPTLYADATGRVSALNGCLHAARQFQARGETERAWHFADRAAALYPDDDRVIQLCRDLPARHGSQRDD